MKERIAQVPKEQERKNVLPYIYTNEKRIGIYVRYVCQYIVFWTNVLFFGITTLMAVENNVLIK